MNLPLAVAVACLALLGTAKAELGEKLEDARQQKPNLVEKEIELYGRTFVARIDSYSNTGVKFIDYFLDGEKVEVVAVINYAPDQTTNRIFNEEYAEKYWGLVFGKENVEDKKERKNRTIWTGQNGSSLEFGTEDSKGKKAEYIIVSSVKIKVIEDKYYKTKIAKTAPIKSSDDDDGIRVTFGGNKNKQYRPPQFYKVAPGGAVYDGNSGRYLGHTIGGNGDE